MVEVKCEVCEQTILLNDKYMEAWCVGLDARHELTLMRPIVREKEGE